jgi:hypothetical protein
MARCLAGHESANIDFCDICGARIIDTAGYGQDRGAGKHRGPGRGAANDGPICPGCGAAAPGQFCDACGLRIRVHGTFTAFGPGDEEFPPARPASGPPESLFPPINRPGTPASPWGPAEPPASWSHPAQQQAEPWNAAPWEIPARHAPAEPPATWGPPSRQAPAAQSAPTQPAPAQPAPAQPAPAEPGPPAQPASSGDTGAFSLLESLFSPEPSAAQAAHPATVAPPAPPVSPPPSAPVAPPPQAEPVAPARPEPMTPVTTAPPPPPAPAAPPLAPASPGNLASATRPIPALAVTWTVLVASDRAYYDQMKSVRDQRGPDVAFPAHPSERRIRLTGSQMRIGRRSATRELKPEIDLAEQPVDPGVSRLHAVLIGAPDGTWSILDPGSANGTLLNGREIPAGQQIPLREGDRINLGAWTVISLHRS